MERKILWVGSILLSSLIIIALLTSFVKKREFKGVEISPAPKAPEISLIDQKGNPFSLEAQNGKVVLVYFGYTNCPDICPTTMAKLNQVFTDLKFQSNNIDVIMVTTDPKRDTHEKLNNYLVNFNPRFLGLTGSPTVLSKVWHDYGVSVSDDGTTHSTSTYVIDQSGYLRLTFPYEMSPSDMVSDLQALLDEE
jgi:protein SCO1/2